MFSNSAKQGATRRQVMAGIAAVVTLAMSPFAYAKEVLYRFKIKISEILIDGPKAIIANKSLSKAVKKNKAIAVKSLSTELGALTVDQVSLDKDGRVVIANQEAAKKLKDLTELKARGPQDDINYNCKGCK